MKKSLVIAATVASLGLATTLAFAEDRGEAEQRETSSHVLRQDTRPQGNQEGKTQQVHKEEQDGDNNQETEDIDTQGFHHEESDLRDELNNLPDIRPTLSLREANASTTVTYADIVSLLNEYQKALDTLTSPITLASTTLSVQEQQLFNALKVKDSFELGRTNARAAELRSQINDLSTLLTPLGTQPISEKGGLKHVLFETVNDIRSAILDTGDLHDISNDILYEENN